MISDTQTANSAAPDPGPPLPLSVVAAGAAARILQADLPPEDRAQLEALGIREGTTLRVWPNGGGCIVQVDGTRVALAKPVARRILVTPVEAGAEAL